MEPKAKNDFEMLPVEKEKSFEIEVSEVPAEPELTPAEIEYQKKQEELNRQIEEIKRQIKIQQEEKENYEREAQAKREQAEIQIVLQVEMAPSLQPSNVKLPEKYELLAQFANQIDQALNML